MSDKTIFPDRLVACFPEHGHTVGYYAKSLDTLDIEMDCCTWEKVVEDPPLEAEKAT